MKPDVKKLPKAVVHVVPSLDVSYGGPAVSVPSLAAALDRRGIRGILVSIDANPLNALIESTTLPWLKARPGPIKKGYYSPNLTSMISAAVQEIEADTIHVHTVWGYPLVAAHRVARKTGCRLVVSPRSELYVESMRKSRLLKALVWPLGISAALAKANLLHATESREESAISSLGLPSPVATAANGIDLSISEKLIDRHTACESIGIDPQRYWVLFLSRLHPRKGPDLLIEAWAKAKIYELGWGCLIAGASDDSRYERQLRDRASALGLEPSIVWLGHIEGGRKIDTLAASDAFVLPTQFENFGMSIAEAMACSLPIITTDQTPWQSIASACAGWIIPANDVNAIEKALAKMAKTPSEMLRTMGTNAKQLVQPFSWEMAAEQMIVAYGMMSPLNEQMTKPIRYDARLR
ncbi:glycosyltransferase [Bradyrhizobium yuanmingense]|nr:glycosyltransferase [Bradyrhizobium sp. NBAIM01]UWU88371.1 glycosyltransferase [Bradyrhizobium sp. CB1024]